MADHEFFGTVSAQAATESDHLPIKSQLDAGVAQALVRANHTGTQPMSTISDAQTYVDGRIQLVVDAAPAALDTLNELAAALGDDPNFSATVTGLISGLDTRLDTLEAAAGTGGDYLATIGDAVASSFTVTHNLGTRVRVEVVRISDGQTVYPVIKRPGMSTTQISVDFGSFVPPNNSYEVYVVPLNPGNV